MKRTLAALFALTWCGLAQAQELLKPHEFRDAGIARIQALAPGAEVEIRDELGITVHRQPGDEGYIVNFDNAYREYTNDPAVLDAILDRYARFATTDVPSERATDRVIGILRHRDILREVDATFEVELIWRPFAGDLIEILVFDSAERIEYAQLNALQDLGLTIEEAWALTATNVRARMGPIGREELAPGVEFLSGENGITPSVLTVPDFCTAPETVGRLYLVLERNGILIGDGRDPEMRVGFLRLARNAAAAGDSMSASPLECREGRLTDVAER